MWRHLILVIFTVSAAALVGAVPSQVGAKVGDSVSFSCPKKEGKTEFEVMKWLKGRYVIFEDDGMVVSEKWSSDKFDVNLDSPTQYNLTINTITMDDKDTYTCLVEDQDDDEETTIIAYELIVLENPKCDGTSRLVNGNKYEFTCRTGIMDATLLWQVGTNEKVVGENLIKETPGSPGARDPEDGTGYKTNRVITADSAMAGQFVTCELQHPSWDVNTGKLTCKVGPLAVESQIHITCEENDQTKDAIVCKVTAKSQDQIVKDQIKWTVKSRPGELQEVEEKYIMPLEDGTGYKVILKTNLHGEQHGLRVGGIEGPWHKMPKKEEAAAKAGGAATGMIIVIVVIVFLLLLIVILVVLYKRNIIFKKGKESEDSEKGAPKLTDIATSGVDKNLLDHKDVSNVEKKQENSERRKSSNSSEEDKNNLIVDTKPRKTDHQV